MDSRRALAWNVRSLRVASERSTEQLADDAGVDYSLVARIERGTANPTLAVIDKLADALSVSVARLLEPIPKGASPPKPLPGGRRAKK